MKAYCCVNCGYHGDFGFYRVRNVKCDICSYEDLAELTEEEFANWKKNYKKFQDENPFYKTKGKVNALGKPFLTDEEKEERAKKVIK